MDVAIQGIAIAAIGGAGAFLTALVIVAILVSAMPAGGM